MNSNVKRFTIAALEYRIGVFWFCLFSLNSLGTCVLAASSGCVWEQLDTQSKLTVIVAVMTNWTGTVMAFLSKTAQRIKQNPNDLPIDDAQFIDKPVPKPDISPTPDKP